MNTTSTNNSAIESTTTNESTVNATMETKSTKTVSGVTVKKPSTKKSGAKKPSTKKVETKKEEKKVQPRLTIQDVEKVYDELGLKYSPVKGDYRIMAHKGERNHSSLNLHRNDIVIYSTDLDAKAVEDAKIDGVEIEHTNNSDPGRSWAVRFTDFNLLKTVLAVYAKNPLNCIEK